jgi:pantothenate kinase type III
MRIGAHLGYQGMVREILAELRKELGRGMNVCATGGFARWVLADFNGSIPVDPNLTLKGLARIAELN